MKKIVSIFILLLILITGSITYAESSIKIIIDGKELVMDQQPIIKNGRTLVPISTITNSLGMEAKWDGLTKKVTIIGEKVEIVLQINNKNSTVNNEIVELDVPAMIINGRTMVPVSFIAKATGAEISWNPESKTVAIKTTSQEKIDEKEHVKFIPSHDSIILYKNQEFIDLLRTQYDVSNLYGDGVVGDGSKFNLKLSVFDKVYYTNNGVKTFYYNSIQLYDKNLNVQSDKYFIQGMKYDGENRIRFDQNYYDSRQFDLIKLILNVIIGETDSNIVTGSISEELQEYLDDNGNYNEDISELNNAVRYYGGYKIQYYVSYTKIEGEMKLTLTKFTIE